MREYQNKYQAAREGAGLTQEAAAERLGWSVRALQDIEQESRDPSPEKVAQMDYTARRGCMGIIATAVPWAVPGIGRKAMSNCSSLRLRSASRPRTRSRSAATRTSWRESRSTVRSTTRSSRGFRPFSVV